MTGSPGHGSWVPSTRTRDDAASRRRSAESTPLTLTRSPADTDALPLPQERIVGLRNAAEVDIHGPERARAGHHVGTVPFGHRDVRAERQRLAGDPQDRSIDPR
jgi:hypothetical protein